MTHKSNLEMVTVHDIFFSDGKLLHASYFFLNGKQAASVAVKESLQGYYIELGTLSMVKAIQLNTVFIKFGAFYYNIKKTGWGWSFDCIQDTSRCVPDGFTLKEFLETHYGHFTTLTDNVNITTWRGKKIKSIEHNRLAGTFAFLNEFGDRIHSLQENRKIFSMPGAFIVEPAGVFVYDEPEFEKVFSNQKTENQPQKEETVAIEKATDQLTPLERAIFNNVAFATREGVVYPRQLVFLPQEPKEVISSKDDQTANNLPKYTYAERTFDPKNTGLSIHELRIMLDLLELQGWSKLDIQLKRELLDYVSSAEFKQKIENENKLLSEGISQYD